MADEQNITINKLVNHIFYLYLTATSQCNMNHIKVIKFHRNVSLKTKLHIITLTEVVNIKFSFCFKYKLNRNCSLFNHMKSSLRIHLASYPTGFNDSFPKDKATRADHTLPLIMKVRN